LERLREILEGVADLFGEQAGPNLTLPRVRGLEFQSLSNSLDALELPDRLSKALLGLKPTEDDPKSQRFSNVSPQLTRSGFDQVLRPYQIDGVVWLSFLFDFGFGGVLADDMGLGKTIQTLAHIQCLKDAYKLTRPALIVAPTSTLPNWHAEMKRFVPRLSLVVLHGVSRKESYDNIATTDVVLTSYPLLVRDREILLKQHYSVVVLDEAQNIKNPGTSAAKAAYEISAESKIALSGTPIENHLEELWSIFRFSLPGLLGGQTEFRREFRTPIEAGQRTPRERLERRIKPFFLRRTKEQVAPELPSKTEIIDYVSLEPSQRELYDAVALAADRQIRDSILAKGWDETRFEALNALLRLRQICCDPRLVKSGLDSPLPQVADSSKLERLISMLVELEQAGRKTLVFSQFTSMLDLIEVRLKKEGIKWVRLCGSTKDRATPVNQFQSGSVPVFLISLKAGGVGLNLTAADTVIHYDPWWNPAVERQATDRAHRIGQDKPVFVYKLVAADTVEERILTMQLRKSELSQMILGEDTLSEASFTPQHLQWILGDSTSHASLRQPLDNTA
jgi:SNF2 family DNA or RNA helicase